MKKTLYLFYCIVLSFNLNTFAQTPDPAYAPKVEVPFKTHLMDTYGPTFLKLEMKRQCYSLTASFIYKSEHSYQNFQKCTAAVDKMLELLDGEGVLAFKAQSLAFSKDPKVWGWISYLRKELIKAYALKKYFTVWGHTLKYTNRDRKLALAYLAVSLQMTEAPGSFRELLQKNAPKNIIDDYEKLVIFLAPHSEYQQDFPGLRLYPKGTPDSLPQFIYHFYTPAYLSYLMQEKGFKIKTAFFIPFLMDYVYEQFNQINVSWTTASQTIISPFESKNNQIKTPVNAEANRIYRAHKIYVGYYGSLFGIENEKQAWPIERMVEEYKKEPRTMLFNVLQQIKN